MREIASSIEIDAPREVVWSALTDFPSYPSWNPFIRRLEGDLALGAKLLVVLQPDGRGPTTFRPAVVEFEPGRSFAWLGHVLVPGVFDGRHRFEVEDLGAGRSRLIQAESFGGILAPLFTSTLAAAERAFQRMNDLVRARAEAAGGGGTA